MAGNAGTLTITQAAPGQLCFRLKNIMMYDDEEMQQLQERKPQWLIQGVISTKKTPLPANYFYTVGLSDMDLPEVLVFGLPPNLAGYFLNIIGFLMQDGRLKLEDGLINNELGNLPFRFKHLNESESANPCFQAYEYGRTIGKPVEVFMMELPDAKGRFPDDPQCDQQMKSIQNLINYQ